MSIAKATRSFLPDAQLRSIVKHRAVGGREREMHRGYVTLAVTVRHNLADPRATNHSP
jgi:hypothetical protein